MTARNAGDDAFTPVAAGTVVILFNAVSVGVPGAAMVTGAAAKVTRRRRQNKGGTYRVRCLNTRADRLCYGNRALAKKTKPMNDRFLKTGVFLAPFHALTENPLLALDRDMELLGHLDRLNYHEAWIGEHHSGGYEIIACPEMFIAAAAERTRHIRLGTGVVSLPYHNPFIVAGRMVQLDYQTRGRAMLGVGPGSLVHDAKKIGIDPADQRRMMNESLDVVIELLAGKNVTRKTDWFDLRDAQLQLPPYTRPRMEMAVAAARSPAGALAAGRHGLGMLSIGGTSDDALKHHRSNWDLYATTAADNGHVPDRKN